MTLIKGLKDEDAFVLEQMWFVSGDDGGLPLFTPPPPPPHSPPHHITPMTLLLFLGSQHITQTISQILCQAEHIPRGATKIPFS